jgi:enoyl-CoA hydratase
MTLPTYETLKTEMNGEHVLLVTMNRPQSANALNTQMGLDFLDLWTRLTDQAGEVRCVVLTGAGEKIFCAGGDLKERNGMTREQWVHQHQIFERQYWTLVDLCLPVIAAVNGHAYGGGFETVLSCDFAYAAKTARFALPEVTLGIMPGTGGTQNLPRAIGERRAKEMIMSGRPITAQQALEWGALNGVYEPIKKSIRFGMQMEVKTAYRFEVEAYNHLVETEDRYEGVRAFNEKRRPVFKGR